MAFEVGVRVLGLGLGLQELRFQTHIYGLFPGGPCRCIVHTWGPKGSFTHIYIYTYLGVEVYTMRLHRSLSTYEDHGSYQES